MNCILKNIEFLRIEIRGTLSGLHGPKKRDLENLGSIVLNLQDKPDHVWGKVFCINSSLQVSNRQIPRFKKMARCKTRLGNQLSSYAAVRYFQER